MMKKDGFKQKLLPESKVTTFAQNHPFYHKRK